MDLKILNGTPKSGDTLCRTCSNALIIRGQNFEEEIFCQCISFVARPVRYKVEKCTRYYMKTLVSLVDMEKIAWIISTESLDPIGFAPETERERHVTIKKPDPTIQINVPSQKGD